MSKVLKYLLLSCALFLVLGHSLIPHNHRDEHQLKYRIVHSGSHSFVEIFKLALSNNLGANHFEEFKSGKKFELTDVLDLDTLPFELFQFEHFCNYLVDFEFNNDQTKQILFKDHILVNSPLRAPPTRS
jgi:hypothetical protein